MNNNRRPKPARVYAVRDASGLAAAVQAALEARFGGVQYQARHIVPQPTLSRLLRGEARTLRQGTFDALQRLMTERDGRDALFDAVVGPDADAVLYAHNLWIAERANRFFGRRGRRWVWRRGGVARYPKTRSASAARHDEFDGLLSALERHPTLASYFNSFKKWCTAHGHVDGEYQFACVRVLEPLLECRESGFVERGWHELDIAELGQFVEAGFTRERILLNRAPRDQRAQEVSTAHPKSRATPLGKELSAKVRDHGRAERAEERALWTEALRTLDPAQGGGP